MGIIVQGIPDRIVRELAKLNEATVFVETGTALGTTTRWASKHFETVFTIEQSDTLFNLHSKELSQIKGVKPLLGNSREILPSIVAEIGDRKAVFWLDAHWSAGETSGEDDECPLIDELACLSDRVQDIILIDDARLFLSAPPRPHKPSQWPTITDIVESLPRSNGRPHVQIIDDVIFAVPDEEPVRSFLIEYAQERADAFWRAFTKPPLGKSLSRKYRSLASRIKSLIGSR